MANIEPSVAELTAQAVRISGRVKWFDGGKGYGFIVPDDAVRKAIKGMAGSLGPERR
jgi:CspA family cold shock protein